MTVRSTMTALIAAVRGLIGDPDGAGSQFSGDAIQTALDAHRQLVRAAALRGIPTPTASGTQWLDFAGEPYFETDAALQGEDYATVTPTTADPLNGRYSFTTPQSPYLYISGNRYDVTGAGADLAEAWAAALKAQIDFSASGSSFKQSQQIQNLLDLAKRLRGKTQTGGVNIIRMKRSDDRC